MKINYRPEIDGLRAIAVLAVIIYHLNIDKVMPGGYLGVDVFFVISGFLISSIILKEIASTGSFSFINFYKRRIRRLMPVFFVVLLSSMVAAWFILLPSQYVSFAKSGLASIFFFSNHFWYSTALDYEAQSSLLEPLLHTWTLAVEEQFYLVFPVLLVLAFTYIKKFIFPAILVLTLASLLFAASYTSIYEAFNFYLLPARFWELSTGALLAILNYKEINLSHDHPILRNLPSLLLLVLIGCFFYFDHETKHPGLITLVPVLSTVGIIFYAHPKDLATKLFSSKPLVAIGLLSYSLYLWHFPVFAFARNLKFENSMLDFSIWIGLTFLLSILSYKFIEKPYRNRSVVDTRKFTLTIIPLLLISAGSLFLVIGQQGFPDRFNRLTELYTGYEIDNKKLGRERSQYFKKANSNAFFEQEKTNVLIVGDSHSRGLFIAFELNKMSYPGHAFKSTNFSSWNNTSSPALLENELLNTADIVIICYRFIEKMDYLENLKEFVAYLKEQGKRIIITLNTAEFKSFGREEVFDRYIKEYKNIISNDHIGHYFYENRRDYIHVVNDSILSFAKETNIEYIDRYSLICNDKTNSCIGITPTGKKVFRDESHLTLAGAAYFGSELRKKDCLLKTSFVSNEFDVPDLNKEFKIDDKSDEQRKLNKEYQNIKMELLRLAENPDFTQKEKNKLKRKLNTRRKKLKELLGKN